jgi:hypothetical protein
VSTETWPALAPDSISESRAAEIALAKLVVQVSVGKRNFTENLLERLVGSGGKKTLKYWGP